MNVECCSNLVRVLLELASIKTLYLHPNCFQMVGCNQMRVRIM